MIRELEAERDILSSRQIKLQRIIDDLKNLDRIKVDVILTKKSKDQDNSKRPRSTNSDIEEKKRRVGELIREGKLTRVQIAEKVGVHVSSTYNWFNSDSSKKKPEEQREESAKQLSKLNRSEKAKIAYKKKWGDGHPSDNRQRKHKCENCHEEVWSAWLNGKQLCKRCFAIKKKGEEAVIRKEKRNQEVYEEDTEDYDPADLEADDLED